ncbi:MAG: hypothetical protein ABR962_08865 [Candidatus Bathyarchaeia archaeon]|jgi:hypothetical protein
MKPIALAAILVLSILLVPTVFALEQSIQTAKTALPRLSVHSTLLAGGAVVVPDDPGSGGGGQGVICNVRRQG